MLSPSQLASLKEDGFFILPNAFSTEDLALFRAEVDHLVSNNAEGVVFESNGLVRALHGCHQQSDVFAKLIRRRELLEPAMEILGSEVYVHQFKINVKAAFGGDVWPWHQDFIFWHHGDGMPTARAVNMSIFLDEITPFNGPLFIIPGSHKEGMLEVAPNDEVSGWQANVSAKLKYTVPHEKVAALEAANGMKAATGSAGSIMFFDPNLVHASVPNISPHRRELLVITYNSVANTLTPIANPRPEFLSSQDFRALTPI